MCFCETKLGIFCTANFLCWNKYLSGDVNVRTSTAVLLKKWGVTERMCWGILQKAYIW